MKNWDKILDDFARKCKGGSPDMTNPRHLALLRESLIKFGWNENATNEFIGNLREGEEELTPPKPTAAGTARQWYVKPDGTVVALVKPKPGDRLATADDMEKDDEDELSPEDRQAAIDEKNDEKEDKKPPTGSDQEPSTNPNSNAGEEVPGLEWGKPGEKPGKGKFVPKKSSGKNRGVRDKILNGQPTRVETNPKTGETIAYTGMAGVGRNSHEDGILGRQGDDNTAGKGGAGGYFNETQFSAAFTEMTEDLNEEKCWEPTKDGKWKSTPAESEADCKGFWGTVKLSEMTKEERQANKDEWKAKKKKEARSLLQEEVNKAQGNVDIHCVKGGDKKLCAEAKKNLKYLVGRQKQVGKPEESPPLTKIQKAKNIAFNNGTDPKRKKADTPNAWIDKKLESASGGIDELFVLETDPDSDFHQDSQPAGYPVLTTMNEESMEGTRATLEKQYEKLCKTTPVNQQHCDHAKHELEKFNKQVAGRKNDSGGRDEGKADTAIIYYDSQGRVRVKYVNNKESENDIQNNQSVASRHEQIKGVVISKHKEIDDELEAKKKEIQSDPKLSVEQKKAKIEQAEEEAAAKKKRLDEAADISRKIDDNAVDEANQMNRAFANGIRSVIDSEGISTNPDPPGQGDMSGLAGHITGRGEQESTKPKYLQNAVKPSKRGEPNPVRQGVEDKPGEVAKALGKTWIRYKKKLEQIALIKNVNEKIHIPLTDDEVSALNSEDNPEAMEEMWKEIDNALKSPSHPAYNALGDIITQAAIDSAGKPGQTNISDTPGGAGNKLIMKILRTTSSIRKKMKACIQKTNNPQDCAKKIAAAGFFGNMSAEKMLAIYNDKKLEALEKEYERRARNWEEVHGRIVDNHHRVDIIFHLKDDMNEKCKEPIKDAQDCTDATLAHTEATTSHNEIVRLEQILRDIRDAENECAGLSEPELENKTFPIDGKEVKCSELSTLKNVTQAAYEKAEEKFYGQDAVAEASPLDDNGESTQVFIRSFMDGMGWSDYIMNEDGEESKNMDGVPYQPRDLRACLAQLSDYQPQQEPPPHPNNKWRKGLMEHLEKELRVDSNSGAVTFCGSSKKDKKDADKLFDWEKRNPVPVKPVKADYKGKGASAQFGIDMTTYETNKEAWNDAKFKFMKGEGIRRTSDDPDASTCKEVGSDSWRTAGDAGKVEGKLGNAMVSCLKEKAKQYNTKPVEKK